MVRTWVLVLFLWASGALAGGVVDVPANSDDAEVKGAPEVFVDLAEDDLPPPMSSPILFKDLDIETWRGSYRRLVAERRENADLASLEVKVVGDYRYFVNYDEGKYWKIVRKGERMVLREEL